MAPLKNSLRLVYELDGCLAISADFQMSHASFSNHMTHDLSSYSDRSEFTAKAEELRMCKRKGEFHIESKWIFDLSTPYSAMNFIINQFRYSAAV